MPQAPEFWARPGLASDLLAPLGWLYAAAGDLRHGLARPLAIGIPTICVGNLVAGGAGKTPAVLGLARVLAAAGRRPHILSRGYGGSLAGPVRVDPARHAAREVGDEALLLAAAAPAWIGRDRRASARAAIAAGADILLLDDGYQSRALRYDVALLVIDGEYGLGNGKVMPAGPLRETVARALARASAIVVMGERTALLPRFDVPLLAARLVPRAAEDLHGRCVAAFAGIGRPAKFFQTLAALGAMIGSATAFPDHHDFTESDLARLEAGAQAAGALLVTTEKDWVRLPEAWRGRVRAVKVEVEWQDRAALDRVLAPALAGRDG